MKTKTVKSFSRDDFTMEMLQTPDFSYYVKVEKDSKIKQTNLLDTYLDASNVFDDMLYDFLMESV